MTQDIQWTSELISAMMNLVEQRYSSTMISEELSKRFGKEITRNAVAGKLNRLKIKKEEKPVVVHKKVRANPMPRKKMLLPSDSLHVSINQLDSTSALNMCRYPSRDNVGVTTYCGLPTVQFPDGSKCSWCSMHYMIVTQ